MKLPVTFLTLVLLPALVWADPPAAKSGSAEATVQQTAASVVNRSGALLYDPQAAKGSLVIIGGALRRDEPAVWSKIVSLAQDYGSRLSNKVLARPRIAIFPTASSDPAKAAERAIEIFEKFGADAFMVPVGMGNIDRDYREAVNDPKLVSEVKASHGVYFSGGDQARIISALFTEEGKPTPLLDAVWSVYNAGAVISGTSAGAAVMSHTMCRGTRYGVTPLANGVSMGQEVCRGLGLIDQGWYVEQHCLVRGRFARALVIMHSQGVKYGLGVDENTALVVRGDNVDVIGYRGAIVLDVSEAKQDESIKGFNLQNARLTYLDRGDSINLKTLEITPAEEKNPVKVDYAESSPRSDMGEPVFTTDILGNTTLMDMLTRLLYSRRGEGIGLAFDGLAARDQATPGFEFRFYRDKDTYGWSIGTGGVGEYTVANIHVDIRPVEIGPLYK